MKKSIYDFYKQIYNLSFIKRYSIVPRVHEESVAEHSFFVASIVIKLHEDYNFDLGTAVTMAIIHDWTESYTDDITVATKKKYPELNKVIEKVESKVAKLEFTTTIYNIWSTYKLRESVESKIVKYADILQVIQYAQNEINLGNTEYMKEVLSDAIFRSYELETKLKEYKR